MKLEGIRVVDLSLFLPGPAMTQAMADHGAEVIKVEPPEGEPNRRIGPERDGVSVYFANTHRGKKSLTLDLKHPAGVEALLRLAETADVLVESFRPGVVDRLGVGYQVVSARAEKIVYVSISAFGQTGPYRDRPAHDLAVEATSGTLSVNLGWDGRPWAPAIACADMLASNMALAGVLMALLRRQTTGKGDYIDVAMMDVLIASLPNGYGLPMTERRQPVARHERTWGGNAMYRVYETKDGRFVALGGAELKFATNLLTALGRPDLIPLCRLPPGPGPGPRAGFPDGNFSEPEPRPSGWTGWLARTSRSRPSRRCARGSTIRRPATATWWSKIDAAGSTSASRSSFPTSPARCASTRPRTASTRKKSCAGSATRMPSLRR